MARRFHIGQKVYWNSEAGHTSGTIKKIHTHPFTLKGKDGTKYTRHASKDNPVYEIKSSKTDHIAYHYGSALHSKSFQKGGGIPMAITPQEQYQGLNNSNYNTMYFPNKGTNTFRGLDNHIPVVVQDQEGNTVILSNPQETAQMKGNVLEYKLAQNGVALPPQSGGMVVGPRGNLDPLSTNPYSSGTTYMIKGPSHKKGGVDMNINGQDIEAEGGEPIDHRPDGSATIWGDLTIPSKEVTNSLLANAGLPPLQEGFNTQFKNRAKQLAQEEEKVNKKYGKRINKISEDSNPYSQYFQASQNTGQVLQESLSNKLKNLAQEKEVLANLQEILHKAAGSLGISPKKLSQKKYQKMLKDYTPNSQEGNNQGEMQQGGNLAPQTSVQLNAALDQNLIPVSIMPPAQLSEVGQPADNTRVQIQPQAAIPQPQLPPNNSGLAYDPDLYLQAIFGNEGGKTGVKTSLKGTATGKYQITKPTRRDIYNKHFKDDFPTFQAFDNQFKTDPDLEYAAARALAIDRIKKYGANAFAAWYYPAGVSKGDMNFIPAKGSGNKISLRDYQDKALRKYQELASHVLNPSSGAETFKNGGTIKAQIGRNILPQGIVPTLPFGNQVQVPPTQDDAALQTFLQNSGLPEADAREVYNASLQYQNPQDYRTQYQNFIQGGGQGKFIYTPNNTPVEDTTPSENTTPTLPEVIPPSYANNIEEDLRSAPEGPIPQLYNPDLPWAGVGESDYNWGPQTNIAPNQVTTSLEEQPSRVPNSFWNELKNSASNINWNGLLSTLPYLFDRPEYPPVQQYHPRLMDYTYADNQAQRNRVLAQLNATRRLTQNNPAALGALQAAANQQISQIDENERNVNAQNRQNIYNQNQQLINDAELRNIQLAGIAEGQKAQATANTRSHRQQAVSNFIENSNRDALNRQKIAMYQPMMPNYKFDPRENQWERIGPNPELVPTQVNGQGNQAPISFEAWAQQQKALGNKPTREKYAEAMGRLQYMSNRPQAKYGAILNKFSKIKKINP